MTPYPRTLAEEAQERADKATPAPWTTPTGPDRLDFGRVEAVASQRVCECAVGRLRGPEPVGRSRDEQVVCDADFIAHARSDVPALADAVLRLVGKPGSERCGDCGRHYLVVWAAPNELWNRIWGDGSGMLCPDCFSKRCEAAGVLPFFVCFPEHVRVDAVLRLAEENERLRRIIHEAIDNADAGGPLPLVANILSAALTETPERER